MTNELSESKAANSAVAADSAPSTSAATAASISSSRAAGMPTRQAAIASATRPG